MIITSFSQKGYHEYGKTFIESFLQHWKDEELTVYYERKLPRNHPTDDRLHYVNLHDFKDFLHFERMMKDSDPLFHGTLNGKQPKETVYNFRYDANRFFRKVFAITHYAQSQYAQFFAWLDADVIVHSDVPENYLQTLLPEESFVAFLNRPSLYTETGFLLFDIYHDKATEFFDMYWNLYATGAFKYLGEYHDCYVFDFVRTLLEVPEHALNAKETDHPFINSDLGKYMDHMKGPERKQAGRSDPSELKVKHDAPHWDIPVEAEAQTA